MMSATSFNLARRMTEKNEPDLLRKCFVQDLVMMCVIACEMIMILTCTSRVSRYLFYVEEEFVTGESSRGMPLSSIHCPLYLQLFLDLSSSPSFSTVANSSGYSEAVCQQLVKKVTPDSPLPKQCQKYDKVVKALQRRDSNRSDQAKAFAGMSPHDMSNAMAARERGHLNHHQIQRRLTTRHR